MKRNLGNLVSVVTTALKDAYDQGYDDGRYAALEELRGKFGLTPTKAKSKAKK